MVNSNEPGVYANGDTPYYKSIDGNSYALIQANRAAIVNADIATGAAIARSKLEAMTQNVVTGSRALSTVYQNTTGKPMFVSVYGKSLSGTEIIQGFTDGSNPPTTEVSADYSGTAAEDITVSFWVMPNNYYEVVLTSSGSKQLDGWTEWY